MSAVTVAPMANPIRARRTIPLMKKCVTGEAGCCSSVANEQVQNMNRLISPASMRYSGQCRRKLAETPKVSLTVFVFRTSETSLAQGPSYAFDFSSPFQFQVRTAQIVAQPLLNRAMFLFCSPA
jgi:hypothetical protein